MLLVVIRFPLSSSVVYCGNETPEGMINYDDVISKGSHMQENVDQEMEDDDLAGVFYTGGTTGRAKGVMLSHNNVMSNAINTIIAIRLHRSGSMAACCAHVSSC